MSCVWPIGKKPGAGRRHPVFDWFSLSGIFIPDSDSVFPIARRGYPRIGLKDFGEIVVVKNPHLRSDVFHRGIRFSQQELGLVHPDGGEIFFRRHSRRFLNDRAELFLRDEKVRGEIFYRQAGAEIIFDIQDNFRTQGKIFQRDDPFVNGIIEQSVDDRSDGLVFFNGKFRNIEISVGQRFFVESVRSAIFGDPPEILLRIGLFPEWSYKNIAVGLVFVGHLEKHLFQAEVTEIMKPGTGVSFASFHGFVVRFFAIVAEIFL